MRDVRHGKNDICHRIEELGKRWREAFEYVAWRGHHCKRLDNRVDRLDVEIGSDLCVSARRGVWEYRQWISVNAPASLAMKLEDACP